MTIDRPPGRIWSAAVAHTITEPVIAVVMGVSGSGKTTVAVLLAAALGCQFQEGDDLHPAANVEKTRGGTPLTDADRWPWLQKIAGEIDDWRARGESGVMTCSALKRSYRDIIIGNRPDVTLVYLKGSHDLIRCATVADLVVGGWLIDRLIALGYHETPVRKTVLVCGMLLGLAVFGATHTTSPVWAVVWISIALSGLAAAAPVGWSIPSQMG